MVDPSPRRPWPPAFPDVIIHTDVGTRDAHPSYAAAKAGDIDASLALAEVLISEAAVGQLQALIGGADVILLPIVADEATGFNAIPDAMANLLGRRLQVRIEVGGIVQVNKVGHTRAPAFQRIVTPALFEGAVQPGSTYLLVDDHVGLGGTLANLRGHVEAGGGTVIGMTTLTESRSARHIALHPDTRRMLWERHGQPLEDLWQSQFGHGIDCLTEVEAQNLCRQPSVTAIEDFLAQAAVEARGRGLEPTAG